MVDNRRFNCLFNCHDLRFPNARDRRVYSYRRNSISDIVPGRNKFFFRDLYDHFISSGHSFGPRGLLDRCAAFWTARDHFTEKELAILLCVERVFIDPNSIQPEPFRNLDTTSFAPFLRLAGIHLRIQSENEPAFL